MDEAKQSVPEKMAFIEMSIALNALASMKWRRPVQVDMDTFTFEAGAARIEYEVSRRLSGWGSKLSVRANKILIYEAHIVPRRGQSDTDLINAWDRIYNKMQEIKSGVVDSTRALAYEDLEDWIREN